METLEGACPLVMFLRGTREEGPDLHREARKKWLDAGATAFGKLLVVVVLLQSTK